MESSKKHTAVVRKKRTMRVRKRLRGDMEKPRLCVVKSNRHVTVQAIDDEKHITLASFSTIGEKTTKSKESGKQIGLKIAEFLKSKKVKRVVLDRGRFKYHGVIAAVADGAREGGLEF
ncbi:MAG: 50S ribosomal protein L18 [Chlamydiales bacterium]|nr:50S ribosomal protein L18 [Chlamydiales bacterium]